MTSALALNLLSSLLAFLLGAGARGAHQRWKTFSRAQRVWRMARADEVVVVQSDGPGHDTPLPTLYEGDARASEIVAQYLRSVLAVRTVRTIRASGFSRCRDARSDLVIVGGPNANGLFAELQRRASLPYEFVLHADRADMVRTSDGAVFAQEVVNAGTVRDFALVGFLPSPFDPARRVVVLAGCGTLGTLAAARMVTFDAIAETAALRLPTTPAYFVIEIEIVDGQPTRPQIIDTIR